MKRLALSVLFAGLLLLAAFAQVGFAQTQTSNQTAVQDAQSVSILRSSLSALMGGNALNDVTLTGSASRTAGSDDETGQATLKATALGQSRIDLTLTGGNRSESRDSSQGTPQGAWSVPNSSVQPIPQHNLMTEPTCSAA